MNEFMAVLKRDIQVFHRVNVRRAAKILMIYAFNPLRFFIGQCCKFAVARPTGQLSFVLVQKTKQKIDLVKIGRASCRERV